jgi:hypothetical protein
MKKLVIALIMMVTQLDAGATEQKIIQIGGGNKIENSQGQIEDNVIWLSEILKRSSGDVSNYFAAGQSNEKDVALYGERDVASMMEPLSRVFEGADANRLVFKKNDVPDVSGSMRKNEITTSLSKTLEQTTENQDVLLIYNGHGDLDESDVRQNSIKVWGDERLNVSDVDKILDSAPKDATIRFVFPQCFSGGFYSLIFNDPMSKEISTQNRCGFFAESAYEESEGCSLSTNKDEYRDYSTYFFAPLNGSTRQQQPLPINADIDHDGVITFHESHLYALLVGESKDLSRSTSEIYLENWTPWYLRWSYGNEDKQSIYWKIAEHLSKQHKLSTDGGDLAARKKQIIEKFEKTLDKQETHKKKIAKLSEQIKGALTMRWPELSHPYTTAFVDLINQHGDEISSAAEQHKVYRELVKLQDEIQELQVNELMLEREQAQIDKIVRMKKLARLQNTFDQYAAEREKQIYKRLLSCEKGEFFMLESENTF